jgi:hypothetical protein
MSRAKDVLQDQLLANANDPSWYVSFSESVVNLTEEEAFWKPNDESNSTCRNCTTSSLLE